TPTLRSDSAYPATAGTSTDRFLMSVFPHYFAAKEPARSGSCFSGGPIRSRFSQLLLSRFRAEDSSDTNPERPGTSRATAHPRAATFLIAPGVPIHIVATRRFSPLRVWHDETNQGRRHGRRSEPAGAPRPDPGRSGRGREEGAGNHPGRSGRCRGGRGV